MSEISLGITLADTSTIPKVREVLLQDTSPSNVLRIPVSLVLVPETRTKPSLLRTTFGSDRFCRVTLLRRENRREALRLRTDPVRIGRVDSGKNGTH